MPTVRDLLGVHAYTLVKYGVRPDEELNKAVEKLQNKAPHMAKFLQEIGAIYVAAGGL